MSEETAAASETVVTVGMESSTQTVTSESQVAAAARMMADLEETMSRPLGKTDSPSKRKGHFTATVPHSKKKSKQELSDDFN